MIAFTDSLIKFILNEIFGADFYELTGDVYYFNNRLNIYGSITRDDCGWVVRYNSVPVEIVVAQDGGEADDLITAITRAEALAESAVMIVGRVAERGWEAVNHPRGAVCRFYNGGSAVNMYQNNSQSRPFSVVGPRSAVVDFLVAGEGMVDNVI